MAISLTKEVIREMLRALDAGDNMFTVVDGEAYRHIDTLEVELREQGHVTHIALIGYYKGTRVFDLVTGPSVSPGDSVTFHGLHIFAKTTIEAQ